jgi:hypothetical protein
MKYHGVRIKKNWGRQFYMAYTTVDGKQISFGSFEDPKMAAKAYDLGIVKMQLDRPTNFLSKINLENKN